MEEERGGDTRADAATRPLGQVRRPSSSLIRQVQIDPAFLSSGARPIVSGAIYCDGLLGALIIGSASSQRRSFFRYRHLQPQLLQQGGGAQGTRHPPSSTLLFNLSMVQLRSHVSTLRLSHPSTPSRSHESPGESSGQYGRPSPRVPQPQGSRWTTPPSDDGLSNEIPRTDCANPQANAGRHKVTHTSPQGLFLGVSSTASLYQLTPCDHPGHPNDAAIRVASDVASPSSFPRHSTTARIC